MCIWPTRDLHKPAPASKAAEGSDVLVARHAKYVHTHTVKGIIPVRDTCVAAYGHGSVVVYDYVKEEFVHTIEKSWEISAACLADQWLYVHTNNNDRLAFSSSFRIQIISDGHVLLAWQIHGDNVRRRQLRRNIAHAEAGRCVNTDTPVSHCHPPQRCV